MPLVKNVRTCSSSQVPVDVYYEEFFPDAAAATSSPITTLIMIPGLNNNHYAFDDDYCRALSNTGPTFRVVKIDNRDVGQSTKMDQQGQPWLFSLVSPTWMSPAPAYTLTDMALDAWALLEKLGVTSKVVVYGNSMGGMIAQEMAILHPEKILSLVIVMSSTFGSGLSSSPLWVRLRFLQAPKSNSDEDVITFRTIFYLDVLYPSCCVPTPTGSVPSWLGVNRDKESVYLRELLTKSQKHSRYRDGAKRHITAINHTRPREELLRKLDVPALVIHGESDVVFAVDHAKRTADVFKNSTLRLVEHMGHFVHPSMFDKMCGFVGDHIKKITS